MCNNITRFVLIFVFVIPSLTFAADKYVSPSGSGTTCSVGSPCSASYAMANAVAGETWYFADGVYSVSQGSDYKTPALSPAHSGTTLNPIIFKSTNHLGANIKGTGNTLTYASAYVSTVVGAYQQDYIVWDGFLLTARNASNTTDIFASARFEESDGSTIINCKLIGGSHNQGGGANNAAVFFEYATNLSINNNEIAGYVETSGNENNGGLIGYDSSYVSVRNNYIHGCTEGIRFKDNIDDSVIENNFIYANRRGVYISNTNSGGACQNNTIKNNIISGQSYAGLETPENGTEYADNLIVFNNTIYSNGSINFRIGAMTTGSGPTIYNNIVGGVASTLDTRGSNVNILAADHNQWTATFRLTIHMYESNEAIYTSIAAWQASAQLYGGGHPGTGDLASDPQFVAAMGARDTVAEYALAGGSLCIGAGRSGSNIGANHLTVGIEGHQTCSEPNGIQDGDETGVDCGGSCPACASVPVGGVPAHTGTMQAHDGVMRAYPVQ